MRAAITGWGTALPERRLTNAELEQRVDTTDQWIVERTGIRERRIAGSGETTASLAIEAGAAAIKHAGVTPDAIDLLIVATATTEQLIPHTGAFVGDGLGIRCGSFDLNAGCAGFVYELVVGSSMLTAGNLEHVLVIGSETLSRVTTPTTGGRASSSATAPPPWCSARHRTTAPACSPGTSAATDLPPASSRSPPVGADDQRRPRPSPTASTTSRWPGPRCSAARCASWSSRPAPRCNAAG
jgi:3-hydroxy-3-methylglutaryl CoA synthase